MTSSLVWLCIAWGPRLNLTVAGGHHPNARVRRALRHAGVRSGRGARSDAQADGARGSRSKTSAQGDQCGCYPPPAVTLTHVEAGEILDRRPEVERASRLRSTSGTAQERPRRRANASTLLA